MEFVLFCIVTLMSVASAVLAAAGTRRHLAGVHLVREMRLGR